jgi:hypothetical protein
MPFLDGQLFYSERGYWPWAEYPHGSTGLLESYFRVRDPAKAEDCLKKLALDSSWPYVRAVLLQRSSIKGHTRCSCPKRDFMRRCHPTALEGIRLLRHDVKTQNLQLPCKAPEPSGARPTTRTCQAPSEHRSVLVPGIRARLPQLSDRPTSA